MGLVDQWQDVAANLPQRWAALQVGLTLSDPAHSDEAAALLAPLQPLRATDGRLVIAVGRDGSAAGPRELVRGLARLDAQRLRGALGLLEQTEQPGKGAPPSAPGLAEGWQRELAALPEDWSDLLGEVELDSSDYLTAAAVLLAPINPRRHGERTSLRFRSARHFGYGASAGMVRVCLERCDREDIRGHVRVLQVLCDTRPVGTQGPVWQIDGSMT